MRNVRELTLAGKVPSNILYLQLNDTVPRGGSRPTLQLACLAVINV